MDFVLCMYVTVYCHRPFSMHWTQLIKFVLRWEGFPGLRNKFRRNLGRIWWRLSIKKENRPFKVQPCHVFEILFMINQNKIYFIYYDISPINISNLISPRRVLKRAWKDNLAEQTFWLLFLPTAGTRTKLLKRCSSQRCWSKWMRYICSRSMLLLYTFLKPPERCQLFFKGAKHVGFEWLQGIVWSVSQVIISDWYWCCVWSPQKQKTTFKFFFLYLCRPAEEKAEVTSEVITETLNMWSIKLLFFDELTWFEAFPF